MAGRRSSRANFDTLLSNQKSQTRAPTNVASLAASIANRKGTRARQGETSRQRFPTSQTPSASAEDSKNSFSSGPQYAPRDSSGSIPPRVVEPGAFSVRGPGRGASNSEAGRQSVLVSMDLDQMDENDENAPAAKVVDTVLAEHAELELMEKAAIEAEERVYKGDVIEGSAERSVASRKKALLFSAIVGLLVVVAIVVGVVVGTRKNSTSGNANVDPPQAAPFSPDAIMPTSSPIMQPPIFVPDDGISTPCSATRVSNDVCECAVPLDASDFGVPIGGSNIGSGRDPVATCDRISANGAGVWYRLEGENTRLIASTCESTADTQLSVFSGSCGLLQCVVGNDQLSTCGNGDQSQVGFFAAEGETYFIYVHGYRNTQSFFSLMVEPMVDNDACEMALEVNGDIFGSTAGAQPIGNESIAAACGVPSGAVGVWLRYTEPLDGGFEARSFFPDISTTGFQNIRVAVFEGDDCSTIQCITASEVFVSPGDTYFIFVYGASPEDQGDFVFSPNGDDNNVVQIPPLTNCSDASPLELNTLAANISLAPLGDNTLSLGVCGDNVRFASFPSNPTGFFGNWFVVQGNGGILRATSCFDTGLKPTQPLQLSVYTGSCERSSSFGLECIDGFSVDEECSGNFAVSWSSEVGEMYYIFVQPIPSEPGRPQILPRFSLLVEEIEAEGAQRCAEDEGFLYVGAPPVLGQGMGSSDAIDPVLFGDVMPGTEISWYAVVGTGRSLTVSTCYPESEGTTSIFLFKGSCDGDLELVADSISSSCGMHELVSFDSTFEETYHIAVLENTTMRFAISVDETPVNNNCSQAIGTLFPDSRKNILGSTRSALPSPESSICGRPDESRDVYYLAQGTGADVRLFAEPLFTDFDIRIQVLAGSSCSDLQCEATSDNRRLQWNAIDGELYYIRVSGINSGSFGTYTLKFCQASDISCRA